MPANGDLVIGLDCSTSGCKAIAWDRNGTCQAEGRSSLRTLQARPAWHEQSAEDWWRAAKRALRQVTARVAAGRLAAICLTVQRETFVPVDKAGKPLRNAILWMDERARALLPALGEGLGRDAFHQLTGKPLSGNLSASKIAWLRANEAQVFEQTHRYLDVHAYLVQRLTGEARTGWGCADPTGLFDMQQHDWAESVLQQLGIRREQLPQAEASGVPIGRLRRRVAGACGLPPGLPVVAGTGDGQAASLGAGLLAAGEAHLSLGTSVVSGTYSPGYLVDRAFRTTCAAIPGAYLLETVLLGGLYTTRWFAENFGRAAARRGAAISIETQLESAAAQVPPGALGLLLVPYWNSAMNPYWDAAASGIVVGWRGVHQPQHLYRAILEGIAFEQRLHSQGVAAATRQPVRRYIASGGGARSPLLRQIIADVTGIPVYRTRTVEAAALGAGILAASGAGWYADIPQAARHMTELDPHIFEPDPQRGALYSQLYEQVYQHLFPALRLLLDRLAELTLG
jgi:sugar (pentulose or hexulose) kinase